jgi:hypothetical protein
MFSTRIISGGGLLALLIGLTLAGCAPPREKANTSVAKPDTPGKKDLDQLPPEMLRKNQGTAPLTAKQFAEEFLKSVSEGQAKADQLSINFKKTFTIPKLEAEQKLGYSDVDAGLWLNSFAKSKYTIAGEIARTKPEPSTIIHGKSTLGDKSDYFLMRLIKSKSGNSWEIDWFQHTSAMLTDMNGSDTDSSLAQDSVQFFFDNLIAGDLRLASGLMTVKLKGQMAPPFSTDKAGYNPGFLEGQLKDRRSQMKSYKVKPSPVAAGETVTFAVETTGTNPQTLKVIVVKDKTLGIWLVDTF